MKKKVKPARPVGGATAPRDDSSLPSPQKGQQTPPGGIPMGESCDTRFHLVKIVVLCYTYCQLRLTHWLWNSEETCVMYKSVFRGVGQWTCGTILCVLFALISP